MAQHGVVDEGCTVVQEPVFRLIGVRLVEDQPGQLLGPSGPTLKHNTTNAVDFLKKYQLFWCKRNINRYLKMEEIDLLICYL